MISACLRSLVWGQPVPDEAFDLRGDTWEEFGARIVDQGCAAALYGLMRRDARFPAPVVDLARDHCERALVVRDCYVYTLRQLRPAMGRVVVIQGLALDEVVYKEQFARPMGDVDLLLPPARIDAARTLLEREGFASVGTHDNVWRRGGLQLDLHEDLWGAERVARRRVFATEGPVETAPSALVPGLDVLTGRTLAAHSAFHALKHGFGRAIWDLDLLLLQRAGWFEGIAGPGARRVAAAAVAMLASKGLVTSGREIGRPLTLRDKALRSLVRRGNRPGAGEIALALACPSWLSTITYLCSSLMPRRAALEDMYGGRRYPALVMQRLMSLAGLCAAKRRPLTTGLPQGRGAGAACAAAAQRGAGGDTE